MCFDVELWAHHNTSTPHLLLEHIIDAKQASLRSLSMCDSTYLTVECIYVNTLVCVIYVHKYKLGGKVRWRIPDV